MSGRVIKENPVDLMIGYFAPVMAAERRRARMMLAMTGGYLGGRRNRRATQNWRPQGGSADADLLPDLPDLRSRARDLARNAPIATGAINTAVTNVVGTGLHLQSTIDRTRLGLDDDAAKAWELAAEREFNLFAETCDHTGEQTFEEMQELAFRAALESGDILIIRRWRQDAGCTYGLKLQAVESDRLSNPDHKADSETTAGGVEINGDGVVQTYHVASKHPGDMRSRRKGIKWLPVPARASNGERLALLLYDRKRPDQTRGIPYLAPVIELLKQLDRYSEAEITAAVVSAMFTVFIKTPDGDGSDLVAGRAGGVSGSEKEQKLGNGMIIDLADGEDVISANPMRPNTAFDPFFQAILRQIGVALEIPFELLIKHFTASYSASRAALEMAWQFFKMRRRWLIRRFCQPVYGWVIGEAVARGRLNAPGFFDDPIIRAAYLGSNWVGPARMSLDPKKDAEADKLNIDMGIETLVEVTAKRTGGDWERNHPQRVREEQMRSAAGLNQNRPQSEPVKPYSALDDEESEDFE